MAGDHVGGVKANTELSNQFKGIAAGFFSGLHFFHEGGCAGFGNCAEMVDQFGFAHADAVIDHGECAGVGVFVDMNSKLRIVGGEFRFFNGCITQAVASIGAVGNEFAQEDIMIGVKRVGDDIEQARNIGAETVGVGRWVLGFGLGVHLFTL